MKKSKALKTAISIVEECEKHDGKENGCVQCPLGSRMGRCLVSGGNDIPTTWNINHIIDAEV